MLECTDRICRLRCSDRLNCFEQSGQGNGFPSSSSSAVELGDTLWTGVIGVVAVDEAEGNDCGACGSFPVLVSMSSSTFSSTFSSVSIMELRRLRLVSILLSAGRLTTWIELRRR